ncbi:AraC family transcriptional regulator [Pseudomonas sp.]|uniref:AraC family transcriptional regulator n=1 Tax=Pseudomonas sp. TaxID=306 RepID=UPI002612D7D0|nr:AraC family transcriptional regulator [Pseudomonas sp.]
MFLDHALLTDVNGKPTSQHHKNFSNDWDEISAWSDRVYMPYRVHPVGHAIKPCATMHSSRIGELTLTRFAYGVAVSVDEFSCEAGNALLLTTIRGNARHWTQRSATEDTAVGESFIANCSRVDYRIDLDPDHLQLNLTIPHTVLERMAQQWFGFVPDDRFWRHKCIIGGMGSSWLSLLEYTVRCVAESAQHVAEGRIGVHLEQSLCVHLLREWAERAEQAGLDVNSPMNRIAPRYVRAAEEFMSANAASLPTLAEVASSVGTSVRALSGAFSRFRGITPGAFLREQRLQGVRRELLAMDPKSGTTVSAIAYRWGYLNLGEFAGIYRKRFSELPSQTLQRQLR